MKKFKEKISGKLNVDKVLLFGSRSKGLEKENSDFDMVIVSQDFKDKKSFKRSPELYFMWDYSYDADIICLTSRELEEKSKEIGIIQEAIKEGIEI